VLGGLDVPAVSPDGRRSLAVLRVDQAADRAITAELNWMSRLER
jgi:hypothetical protein